VQENKKRQKKKEYYQTVYNTLTILINLHV